MKKIIKGPDVMHLIGILVILSLLVFYIASLFFPAVRTNAVTRETGDISSYVAGGKGERLL